MKASATGVRLMLDLTLEHFVGVVLDWHSELVSWSADWGDVTVTAADLTAPLTTADELIEFVATSLTEADSPNYHPFRVENDGSGESDAYGRFSYRRTGWQIDLTAASGATCQINLGHNEEINGAVVLTLPSPADAEPQLWMDRLIEHWSPRSVAIVPTTLTEAGTSFETALNRLLASNGIQATSGRWERCAWSSWWFGESPFDQLPAGIDQRSYELGLQLVHRDRPEAADFDAWLDLSMNASAALTAAMGTSPVSLRRRLQQRFGRAPKINGVSLFDAYDTEQQRWIFAAPFFGSGPITNSDEAIIAAQVRRQLSATDDSSTIVWITNSNAVAASVQDAVAAVAASGRCSTLVEEYEPVFD